MQWNGSDTLTDASERMRRLDSERVEIERRSGRVTPDIDDMRIGEAREFRLAVLHIDINNYKELVNNMPMQQILRFLNTFLSEMTYIVRDYSGIVEKYVGDQVTAVFGMEGDEDLACKHALECAMTMLTIIKYSINPFFESIRLPTFTCSVGIDFGNIWMARIGIDSNTKQFTLVGYAVNIASQLQEMAQQNQILLGGAVHLHLSDQHTQHCVMQEYPSEWIWTWRNGQYKYPIYSHNAHWINYDLR